MLNWVWMLQINGLKYCWYPWLNYMTLLVTYYFMCGYMHFDSRQQVSIVDLKKERKEKWNVKQIQIYDLLSMVDLIFCCVDRNFKPKLFFVYFWQSFLNCSIKLFSNLKKREGWLKSVLNRYVSHFCVFH